jgi:DNA-binding transcriptional MerR regulator
MAKAVVRLTRFEVPPDEPVYVIGVVSTLVQLPIWTLRALDREGIVKAARKCSHRLYTLNDLRLLMHIRGLLVDEGVNLRGVRLILQLRPADPD